MQGACRAERVNLGAFALTLGRDDRFAVLSVATDAGEMRKGFGRRRRI